MSVIGWCAECWLVLAVGLVLSQIKEPSYLLEWASVGGDGYLRFAR